jgi:4-hydroxy-2-oxoheptanedioate aldolase
VITLPRPIRSPGAYSCAPRKVFDTIAGFAWLLIDAEQAPNDPRSVLRQLQAIASYPVQPIVRPVHGSIELIKQYLDLGVQTLLIRMVETAEQAALMVAATRYPTRGIAASPKADSAH